MTLRLHVPSLLGSLVHLEPLSMRHAADLVVAAEEDRGTYGFTWVPKRSEIDDYLHSQLQRAETGKLTPLPRSVSPMNGRLGAPHTGIPAPGPDARSPVPSKSVSPGWAHQHRVRESIWRQSFSSSSTLSRRWAWRGSISRPMLATSGPGEQSRG